MIRSLSYVLQHRVYLVKKAIEILSERRTMDIYYYRGQEEKVKA